jgi:geranylgeranyl diphosphate synthase type II
LILGQALDIEAEGRRATPGRVGAIHLRKTGALIAASMALGALAGGGSPRAVDGLHRAGLDLGLAFQIHDDLLNAGSSLAKLGKRAGTDESRGKATWPRAVGFERAREDERQLTARAEGLIRRTARRPEKLLALVAGLAGRER